MLSAKAAKVCAKCFIFFLLQLALACRAACNGFAVQRVFTVAADPSNRFHRTDHQEYQKQGTSILDPGFTRQGVAHYRCQQAGELDPTPNTGDLRLAYFLCDLCHGNHLSVLVQMNITHCLCPHLGQRREKWSTAMPTKHPASPPKKPQKPSKLTSRYPTPRTGLPSVWGALKR